MSTDVKTAIGKFVWHDNSSTDPARAREFYSQLLGWESERWGSGEMDYEMIKVGGQMHGGIAPAPGGAPSGWVGSVLVEDVDATAEKATRGGGAVLAGPMDIPEIGRYAVIADPQGAVIAAFTPDGEAPGGEGVFGWDELMTSDMNAARRFYADLFGWTPRDMPMGDMGTYTIFERPGGTDAAGGIEIPPGVEAPPHWLPYIVVDDVDATAAKAKQLGGTIIREPFDVPSVGRIAIVQDPPGAVFGLFKGSSE